MAATRRAGANAGQMTSSPTFNPTESMAASNATPAVVAATAWGRSVIFDASLSSSRIGEVSSSANAWSAASNAAKS
jgi:hypothetical protein